MGQLMAVKDRQNSTDELFEPLKQTIELLKVYEQELPDEVYKQLEVRTLFYILLQGCVQASRKDKPSWLLRGCMS